MRRSILMLGSTLALFLYHAKWSPGHFGSRSSPCCSNPRGRHSGLGTWLNGVNKLNKAIAVDGAAEIVEIAINGLEEDPEVEEGGMELTIHMKFSSPSSSHGRHYWWQRLVIHHDGGQERRSSSPPFQAWLVSEIMANSASSINVLTERDQVMPPNSGFHLSLFANYTLDGIKAVLAVSIDSTTGSICGGWDPPTARALAHPAFQPFSWPMLRETSASYTDLKIYNGNEILFHWVFRGYRADTDLTVQQQFVDEILVRDVHRGNLVSQQWWRSSLDGEWRSCHSNVEVAPMQLVRKARS